MSGPRVFAYGLGASSSAGEGVEAAWNAWWRGEACLAPFASAATADPVFAGIAPGDADGRPAGDTAPAVLRLARSAAREALASADPGCACALDLVVGTTVGLGSDFASDPIGAPFGDLADALAAEHGFARVTTVASACTSSMEAIATAADRIRAGGASGAIAGGVDAVSELVLRGFDCLGMLSRSAPRPFDLARSGCALGDGAAFVVLFDEEEGKRRGLRPLAELVAGAAGISDHSFSLAEPEGTSIAETIAAALEAARVAPAELAFVQAFGIGTAVGDLAEANALRAALGPPARTVPITGAKGILGHTLGASGALESALAIRALAAGTVPPLAGLVEPDPACALPGLVREATRVRGDRVLQVGVGLCGQAAALVWRRAA